MNKIFAGMIFLLLSFEVNIGTPTALLPPGAVTFDVIHSHAILELIPDFIGYAVIALGLKELSELSDRFARIIPAVKIMIAYSIVAYGINLFGSGEMIIINEALSTPEVLRLIFGFLSMTLSMFISYSIIMGIREIEVRRNVYLKSGDLYSLWKFKVAFAIVGFTCMFMSVVMQGVFWISLISIVSLITVAVVNICYIFAFNTTRKLFNEYIKEQIQTENEAQDEK